MRARRTNFKHLVKIHGQKVLDNPKKYLLKHLTEYKPTYLRCLKYRINKRYKHLIK